MAADPARKRRKLGAVMYSCTTVVDEPQAANRAAVYSEMISETAQTLTHVACEDFFLWDSWLLARELSSARCSQRVDTIMPQLKPMPRSISIDSALREH